MNAQTTETKKKTAKRVKAVVKENETPKKTKKPKEPKTSAEWLESYTKNELSTSGAVQITRLLTRESGASLQECIELASQIGALKNSNFGRTKSSIKSHLRWLALRSCVVEDLGDERFRVTAP